MIIILIIILSLIMIYSLMKISHISNEMEEDYERKNKRMDKGSRNKSN